MTVGPKEIAVVQRGIKFNISIKEDSRGWVAEIFSGQFVIPDLGVIGANGLANPKDFESSVAFYEEKDGEFKIIQKFQGKLFEADIDHSPFDVVGYHGNYVPYRYDLTKFCAMNTVTFDHPDPSIFTVLTCQSAKLGTAILDFVIFPPRWVVSEHTFRPPYYHRNTMCEFMGLISGSYDAKSNKNGKGFVPGGSSLHNIMTPHGPETEVFKKQSDTKNENLDKPVKYPETDLAFMFESCFFMNTTKWAMDGPLDVDYIEHSWSKFEKTFDKDKENTKDEK